MWGRPMRDLGVDGEAGAMGTTLFGDVVRGGKIEIEVLRAEVIAWITWFVLALAELFGRRRVRRGRVLHCVRVREVLLFDHVRWAVQAVPNISSAMHRDWLYYTCRTCMI